MRSHAALLVLVALAPSVLAHPETPDCGTGAEAGDNYNSATPISIPRSCDAQLNDTWDSTDFYRFSCATGQGVRAELTSASTFLNLRAYVPMPVAPFVLPPPSASDSTTGDGRAVIQWTCHLAGQWRLQILNGGLEQDLLDIPYQLSVS